LMAHGQERCNFLLRGKKAIQLRYAQRKLGVRVRTRD